MCHVGVGHAQHDHGRQAVGVAEPARNQSGPAEGVDDPGAGTSLPHTVLDRDDSAGAARRRSRGRRRAA